MKEINCDEDRFYSFTVLRDDFSDIVQSAAAKLPSQQANSKGLSDCRSEGTEANYILMKLSMLNNKGHTRYGIPIPWLRLAASLVPIVS